jgi:hypothetical protein
LYCTVLSREKSRIVGNGILGSMVGLLVRRSVR